MNKTALSNIPYGLDNFINREMEISKIENLLNPRNRRHLLAICGMGGVGKTALALKVAHRSIEKKEFDAYIWTTAKVSELHDKKIRKYNNSLSNLDDLLDTIAWVVGINTSALPFYEKQNMVLQQLETRHGALIIVDNLESLDDKAGAEILQFLRDLVPHPSKVIITSRRSMHGEGEVEVRLDGLNLDRTFELIKSELGFKRILINLSRSEMGDIYNVTEGTPLAIKFVVAQLGLRNRNLSKILDRINNSKNTPLLEYCFRESYSELSRNAKKMLLSMSIIDRFPTEFEKIKLISGLSESQTEIALNELDILSLVEKENRKYRMHPLTVYFAQIELTGEPKLESEIKSRLNEIESPK